MWRLAATPLINLFFIKTLFKVFESEALPKTPRSSNLSQPHANPQQH